MITKTIDRKNISIFKKDQKDFMQIDMILWPLKGWFTLHHEQLHAWGLFDWWLSNKDDLTNFLLSQNLIDQEDLKSFQKYFDDYEILTQKGFPLEIDRMPMLPYLPINMEKYFNE